MHFLFKLTSVLTSGFIGIILALDSIIVYGLIAPVFRIFMALAGARLLSSDAYNDIANKIYAIVGVVMLFVLAYAILRAIIDPDQSMKNELGPQLIKRIIIAVVGLALAPVIFNVMYQGQNLFLEHDVLAKIFFRGNSDLMATTDQSSVQVGDQSVDIDSSVNVDEQIKEIGGSVTAVNLWQAFFYPSEDSGKTAEEIEADPKDYFLGSAGYFLACAGIAAGAIALNAFVGIGNIASALILGALVFTCGSSVSQYMTGSKVSNITGGDKITLAEAYGYAAGGGSFGIFTVFLNNYVDDGEITYLFGLSTIAGAFTLYAFISFSIDMGVRAAKLAYYQIIAPIPLIMQVLPSFKSNFSQYIKSVISTFMEVFIRISVVYIVVYIICHLTEMFSSVDALWGNQNLSGIETMLALALLILGLVAFARQAPKFIADSLGIKTGDMKLGIGKKFAEGGGFAAKAIAGSGLRTAVQNWNKNKGQGGLKRVTSSLAGGFSAAARSAYSQFGPGEGHKMAMTNEESKRVSGTANEAAYQAGVNRDERRSQNAADREAYEKAIERRDAAEEAYDRLVNDPNATIDAKNAAREARDAARAAVRDAKERFYGSTAVGTIVTDAHKRATVWATGTIDTSKMDRQVKLFQDLAGLKKQLESTVDNDDAVYRAQQELNELERRGVKEITDAVYNSELRKRALREAAQRNTTRLAGETDAAYDARVAREISRLESSTATADLAAINSEMDTLRSSTFKRADFVADAESAEYKAAKAELQELQSKARDELKAAKKDAVARKLVEATAGIDNDTSRAFKSFFETHQQELDAFKDVLFDGQRSLGDYIAENFGARASSGVIDFNAVNKGNGIVTLELKNGKTVQVDTTGDTTTYKIGHMDPTGTSFVQEGTSVDESGFREYISTEKTEVKSSRTETGTAESKPSVMKTIAEITEQKFRDSEAYRTAKSQERAQKESKK